MVGSKYHSTRVKTKLRKLAQKEQNVTNEMNNGIKHISEAARKHGLSPSAAHKLKKKLTLNPHLNVTYKDVRPGHKNIFDEQFIMDLLDKAVKQDANYHGMNLQEFAEFACSYAILSGKKVPETWLMKGRASSACVSMYMHIPMFAVTICFHLC